MRDAAAACTRHRKPREAALNTQKKLDFLKRSEDVNNLGPT